MEEYDDKKWYKDGDVFYRKCGFFMQKLNGNILQKKVPIMLHLVIYLVNV